MAMGLAKLRASFMDGPPLCRPEWRRLGDQRKVDLVVRLHGCRADDDGDEVTEVLSSSSASLVKFMTRDDRFLLHCLTACIDTGCLLQNHSISLMPAIISPQKL